MAQNVSDPQTKEIPLTTFCGEVTYLNPTALPQGASPDCSDVAFLPGGVSSRPCLQKIFTTPFGTTTVTYAKSYVDPQGTIRNLYLDSNGNLWVENVTLNPGAYTLLARTTPGTYAKSITAFGREYIAISDGLHGQEVPLQYDGVNLDRVSQDGPGASPTIANLIIAPSSITSLARAANVVTVVTGGAHGLQVGFQAQISGAPAQAVGTSISSIVINNEQFPGVATVTTSAAHGLVPGVEVGLSGVAAVIVGGGIVSADVTNQILSVAMTTPHGLQPGVQVQLLGTTHVDGVYSVASVSGTNTFTAISAGANSTDSSGDVYLLWPVPDATTPPQYEVIAAPTATKFQIALNYSDGTWASGNLTFSWNGTFFVSSVISTTSFTYNQNGPNGSSGATGTVTPFGQVSPGTHQMQVFFITRQGYTTAPSPPVTFVANGGQYLHVTNVPIGPSNVVARALAFTGAEGAYFFYIPVPAQINGQQVSRATVFNDNTSTIGTLDFSDNTLYASIGISVPGNNLANEQVLEGALGFGFYGSRLLTYGRRNRITNLLNMGFDGGWYFATPNIPTGWHGGGTGTLGVGHFGFGWFTSGTPLTQSFYQDAYGVPIGLGNQQYTFRAWLASSGNVTATISSAISGFSTSATLVIPGAAFIPGWVEAKFSAKMPANIPTDMTLGITGDGILVDEMSIIYTENPYSTGLLGSYVNNPEAFDGVTGVFGPVDDTHPVLDLGIIRDNLYLLTQDPSGRLHETSQGITEPANWVINEVGANCGTVSAFSLTRSQADDSSAAGGEEWFAWFSSTGIRIFGGQEPDKISQEIQRPIGQTFPGAPADLGALNVAAQLTVWGLNDPAQKIMWFGIPAGSAMAPSIVYMLSYLGLDSAGAIAANAPIHKSLSGKLVATDLGRKWSPWKLALNGGALMYRAPGALQPIFFSGNGMTPGLVNGFGNVYRLNAVLLTDQDYGRMAPYYTTYAIPGRDEEQALQLGAHMKMVAYTSMFIAGAGYLTITILCDSLANPWPLTGVYILGSNPKFDLEFPGGQAQSQRFFFRFDMSPNPLGITGSPVSDVQFSLTTFMAALKQAGHLKVRGVYP